MRRRPVDQASARLMAAVDSESRPYTDPKARYLRALEHQKARGRRG